MLVDSKDLNYVTAYGDRQIEKMALLTTGQSNSIQRPWELKQTKLGERPVCGHCNKPNHTEMFQNSWLSSGLEAKEQKRRPRRESL